MLPDRNPARKNIAGGHMIDSAALTKMAAASAVGGVGGVCVLQTLGTTDCVPSPLQIVIISSVSIFITTWSIQNDEDVFRFKSKPVRVILYIFCSWVLSYKTVEILGRLVESYIGIPATMTYAPVSFLGPMLLVWIGESKSGRALRDRLLRDGLLQGGALGVLLSLVRKKTGADE